MAKTAREIEQEFLDAFSSNMSNPENMDRLGVGYKAFKDAQRAVSLDGDLKVFNPNSPYGVMWDSSTDKIYTVGHSIPVIQEQMKRCVCNGNPAHGGKVMYYLDSEDSSKKEDGSDATSDINGSSGYQVFVEIPKFYQKRVTVGSQMSFEIALLPFEGCETHPIFRRHGWSNTGDGTDAVNEVSFDYVSAFEGCLYDASNSTFVDGNGSSDNTANLDLANDKLRSVVGFKPYTGITRSEARTLIANGGGKLLNFHQIDMIKLLYITEYKTFNSQSAIGGYTEFTSGASYDAGVVETGATISLGNKTGSITSTASSHGATNTATRVIANSYRGIENFFGHLWDLVDGMNVQNNKPYIIKTVDRPFQDDLFSGDYVGLTDLVMPSINGWQSTLHNVGFLPKSIGANSQSKVTDYYWQSTGNRLPIHGGTLYNGSRAGVFTLSCDWDSGSSGWAVCGR